MKLLASIVIVAVCLLPQSVKAQSGTAPFCLQTPGGGARCVFGTMGECESARGSTSSAQCITRSDAKGTTGLGERPTGPSGKRIETPPATEPESTER
jgi:hypothetical protein